MKNKSTMELPPLPINVTINQAGTKAILHINCQSDGKVARWIEDKGEGDAWAKQVWLGKLGCLLKLYGNIECQWPHLSMEPNINTTLILDKFNNPWAYTISDFPENYKLFAVERQVAQGENHPRKDYYLCGMVFFLLSV